MSTAYRVLVLGGYGVFGSRLCKLLAKQPALTVIVAGRNALKAATLAKELGNASESNVLDAMTMTPSDIAASRADLVIHVAGPFQNKDYHVANACIGARVHYIDLADGRSFVTGISELDAAAKEAGISVIAGASTVPGLSSAVVKHIGAGLDVTDIEMGISPGNQAPRGTAVIAAILSYVGQPLPERFAGLPHRAFGWQGLFRRTISLPDGTSLGQRWFSSCDVPDLELFPTYWNHLNTLRFSAGLELSIMHLGLWLASWLVRWRLVPRLDKLTGLIAWIADRLEGFGSSRGGMSVEVSGRNSGGCKVTRQWNLIAGSGHGPYVPCLPAALLALKFSNGELPVPGAGACVELFNIGELIPVARGLDIRWSA